MRLNNPEPGHRVLGEEFEKSFGAMFGSLVGDKSDCDEEVEKSAGRSKGFFAEPTFNKGADHFSHPN
jgi:hypothetical protein